MTTKSTEFLIKRNLPILCIQQKGLKNKIKERGLRGSRNSHRRVSTKQIYLTDESRENNSCHRNIMLIKLSNIIPAAKHFTIWPFTSTGLLASVMWATDERLNDSFVILT